MPKVTIIHLRDDAIASRVSSGEDTQLVVAEAPAVVTERVQEAGGIVLGHSVTHEFRDRYYEWLDEYLCSATSAWGLRLSPTLRDVVVPSALGVAARTWIQAELITTIARLNASSRVESVEILTDNDDGRLLEVCLQVPMRSITGHRILRRRLPASATASVRAGRALAQDAIGGGYVPRTRPSPSVVFFADSPRAWRHLDPIDEALRSRGRDTLVLTTRGPMARVLRRSGKNVLMAPPRPYPRGFHRELREGFSALPLGPLQPFESDDAAVGVRAVLAHETLRVARRVLAGRHAVRWLADGTSSFCFAHASYGDPAGAAVTWQADASGVASALIPHGLIDHTRPELAFFPPATVFLAWGELMMEDLAASTLPTSTSVVAVGWPYLEDALTRHHPQDGENPAGTVLVAFGRPSRVISTAAFESAAREVLRSASSRPDLRFVIKVHPSDTSGYWHRLVALHGGPNVGIIQGGDLHEHLAGAWILVTRHSTAGSEAICAGKPVVVVDISSPEALSGNTADYVGAGAVYLVQRQGGLLETIAELESHTPDRLHDAREAYAKRFVKRGDAAVRIARLLEQLAERSATEGVALQR